MTRKQTLVMIYSIIILLWAWFAYIYLYPKRVSYIWEYTCQNGNSYSYYANEPLSEETLKSFCNSITRNHGSPAK